MNQAQASRQIKDGTAGNTKLLCLAVIPKAGYTSFPLYWLSYNASLPIDEQSLAKALTEILTDPLQEDLWLASGSQRISWLDNWAKDGYRWFAERQMMPGVTDNLAHTVEEALALKGLPPFLKAAAGTGYLFKESSSCSSKENIVEHNKYKLFHPLTERLEVHDLDDVQNELATLLVFPFVRLPEPKAAEAINLELDDRQLEELSRDRLLALARYEMKAIRQHFRQPNIKKLRESRGLPESPTDVELEILAQTWSEHCKHKIFNATINHTDLGQVPAKQKGVINSLYKTYIQGATKKINRPDLLSVFQDNAGVVKWNDDWAVCFKVETHNSPSALEPYGGALTGILGVNRDILGTGLGARPIFNTDVFCFAFPGKDVVTRPKLLPAKTILDGVRKGVEDGGNKSGIPTVNGAIFFDKDYRAKPLVFCGTGGMLPLKVGDRKGYAKHTKAGDAVVMIGGRVGKDGIHGATFSSESLHEGSPVSAVQIGDPFTQKRVLDLIMEARDEGLITGITDNGAGGLSSSVGEMAQLTNGATIELDCVPTKYPGLADWEVVVSESQERMTVSTNDVKALKQLGEKHKVEVSAIGTFHDRGYFEVTRGGTPVALLDLNFLHDGVPTLELESEWKPSQITMTTGALPGDLNKILLDLLAHPNIASREQVIRRYDHEVQGQSVIKPLMGAKQNAPCDAAVIQPIYNEKQGLVVSNGLAPRLSAHDCYLMAACSVDEAVRNAVCVGANPDTISLLDNFCWPDPVFSQKNPHGKVKLAQLVRACQGLHDAVIAYQAPLISGKDSMKNDFDDGTVRLSIPPTLLVSAIAKVDDVEKCVTMQFKDAGDLIYLISAGTTGVAGSHYEELLGWQSAIVPAIDFTAAAAMYRKLNQAIKRGLVRSAHDQSEGGLAVAIAESAIGSGLGARIKLGDLEEAARQAVSKLPLLPNTQKLLSRVDSVLFAEGPSRIIVSIKPDSQKTFEGMLSGTDCTLIGEVTEEAQVIFAREDDPSGTVIDLAVASLAKAWTSPLPFD